MSEATPEGHREVIGRPTADPVRIPVRRVDDRNVLAYKHSEVTPDTDALIAALLKDLAPVQVAWTIRQMVERLAALNDTETALDQNGTLIMLQGMEVEVRIDVRRRAAVLPDGYEWPAETKERLAGTVIRPNLASLLAHATRTADGTYTGDVHTEALAALPRHLTDLPTEG